MDEQQTQETDDSRRQARQRQAYRKKIKEAEQQLGRMEATLRTIAGDTRRRTRQRMLERSIDQQRHTIAKLKATAQALQPPPKTSATRYVKAAPKDTDQTKDETSQTE